MESGNRAGDAHTALFTQLDSDPPRLDNPPCTLVAQTLSAKPMQTKGMQTTGMGHLIAL
jgi:hypothetical protein